MARSHESAGVPADDYHVHSTYSDGDFLWRMVTAAEEAGLHGIGVADHCTVATDPERRTEAARNGFALDLTYERRREGIESIRSHEDVGVAVYDAVEMDYHPGDEAAIAEILVEHGVQFVPGSDVHRASGLAEVERALDDRFDELGTPAATLDLE